MINVIKEKIASKQFRDTLKKKSVKTRTSFSTLTKDGKTIVIVYPSEKSKEHETNNSLVFFFNTYPKSEFILVKPSELKKEDLQFSGLPSGSYFDQFKKKRIHMLIDLNDDENIINNYISAKINASLKVRLNTYEIGNEIYHLSLNSEKSNLKGKLQCLLDYSLKLKDVI